MRRLPLSVPAAQPARSPATASAQSGLSLVIVLVLLAVMSLSAAGLLRQAVATEKLGSNFRQQALALQYAETALRYCESQLARADTDPARNASLREAQLPTTQASNPAWNQAASWASTARLTVLPQAEVQSSSSPAPTLRLPECLVEKQLLGSEQIYVITARGFGLGYRADPLTGQSVTGAVVWLQSTVFMDRQAATPLQDRVWRRLLSPVLR